jgi:septal ring factor EnvC (AmiA/AmiB activator)
MDKDLEDNLNSPTAWLPIATIKKIMGIKRPSPPCPSEESPEQSSRLSEAVPNKCINSSKSFSSLHTKYTKNTEFKGLPLPAAQQDQAKDKKIAELEQKIRASETENAYLARRLAEADSEIDELKTKVSLLKTEHMVRLQTLQEQHCLKRKKTLIIF